VLSNGEMKQLARSVGSVDFATKSLEEFEKGRGQFSGAWLETSDSTVIARDHIVEVAVVPISP
jgi:hypothetical protein